MQVSGRQKRQRPKKKIDDGCSMCQMRAYCRKNVLSGGGGQLPDMDMGGGRPLCNE